MCCDIILNNGMAWMAVRAVMTSQGDSCLATVNDALNFAADLLSIIDTKRKALCTPQTFASDELKYFREAQERVKALYSYKELP